MALDEHLATLLSQLPGWRLLGGRIVKTYPFASYAEGVAFAVRVALDAERHDHHPDEVAILWKKVRVAYVTHSAGGVTEKDLAAAARIEAFSAR